MSGQLELIIEEINTTPVVNIEETNTALVVNIEDKNTTLVVNIEDGPGLSAYQIALNNGFVGTVEEWIQSLKGDSAYDIALDNGFVGTEEEWLKSLAVGLKISHEDSGKVLSNDGTDTEWTDIEQILNDSVIEWDLGEL